jgi:transglutaminase-like putative cysteine protease
MDVEGNFFHLCWFEGLHSKLEFTSTLIVDSSDYDPFNFIIYPNEFLEVPFEFGEEEQKLLAPALERQQINSPLLDYGNKILEESGGKTVDFIAMLTRSIHRDFKLEIREEGKPHSPDETFILGRGSCRDLAWMQIQLLRHIGMAARFVSGYFYPIVEDPEFELHAWIEVYIPGAGWIGFDPSHGLMAGNSHIPIASSAHYENAMTVTGNIRGSAASKLSTSLIILKI